MLLQEAVDRYDIENIIVEVSYNMAEYGVVREDRLGIWNAWLMTDYMHPSIKKYVYLLNASNSENYINSFFVARRSWKYLFHIERTKSLLADKVSKTYRDYEYDFVTYEEEHYAEKGYVASDTKLSPDPYFSPVGYFPVNCAHIGENWKNVIDKIILYCKEKDVKLTLVSVPVSSFLNAGRTNYAEYINYMNSLAHESGIEYLDFNLMKEEYWPDATAYFKDDDHLNKFGAELLSEIYSDLINEEITREELFYHSMDEKFLNSDATVYGVSYFDDMEGSESIRRCKIVANYMKDLLYKITLLPSEGGEIEIQDYDRNIYFELLPQDHGICVVSCKSVMGGNDISTYKIVY